MNDKKNAPAGQERGIEEAMKTFCEDMQKLLHYQAVTWIDLVDVLRRTQEIETTSEEKTAQEAETPGRDSRLSKFATCELVNELKHREGVETHEIGMSAKITVEADGPAIVFVVID